MISMSDLLAKLNEQQKEAVLNGEGPAIVLAGAGSGKTTVLTHRVAYLIEEKGVAPESILLVTFTNKAAAEMRNRVKELTGFNLPFSGTFHSLAARILRIDGHHIGLPQGFIIYDASEQLSLIKKIYKENNLATTDFKPKAVLAAISNAKNEMIKPDAYQNKAYGQFQNHTAIIYKNYQKKLKDIGAVDFDDLLLQLIELLIKTPQVLQKYQQRLEHVLIDEYQDTNKAQYTITKLLAAPQNNLYVVGDFSQSIYAWRGADYRNMMLLKTDFAHTKEYKLERNYRSTQNILDAATNIISQNKSHPILALWTDQKESRPITLYAAKDRKDEAQKVLSQIKDLKPGISLSEMAILYRTNAQSRAFEEEFVKKGIPYRVIGGMKFYERKEIKDLLSYLKLLTNQQDEISELRAIKLGKRRYDAYQQWREQILKNYTLEQLEPEPLIREILETTNYLDKFDKKDPEDFSRVDNIKELLNVAAQFDQVLNFLENIALVQNDFLSDSSLSDEPDAITMMSLHAAKGLEFEAVFMVGLEEGLVPHSRSLLDKEQMEEERRLCYVGITRAKKELYLTFAQTEYSYRGFESKTMSRFLHDIPSEILDQQGHLKYSGPNSSQSPYQRKRYVPVDDTQLEGVLSGDIDIEEFLNS